MLLVGCGANLYLTPPEWFDYPSIGVNTIYHYANWKPTYFTGVDNRLYRQDGAAIAEVYKNIPKLIPSRLSDWKGENFYRWNHRAGDMQLDRSQDALSKGIAYINVMTVAMQLAYWMGAKTILILGMEHNRERYQAHFWGLDEKSREPKLDWWFESYRKLSVEMQANGVTMLNISAQTCVPEDVIQKADWRSYAN